MNLLAFFVLVAAYAFFMRRRLLQYLHIFQQEEYAPARFFRWMLRTHAVDKRVSAALLLLAFIPSSLLADMFVAAAVFAGASVFENDPRKTAKKKLAMTARASRVFGVAFALNLAVALAAFEAGSVWPWIFAVQFVPLSLALSNVLLTPFEKRIQKKILGEASAILAQTKPKIIGITGSFGKTSVKHILGHIFEMNAPTLFTPGSVNTLMGISRVIRESLTPDIRYFLVEMGAYGRGSIEKLCRLTPPCAGLITALGEAHYERFKTLDNVARAKFELAEAVIAGGDGKIVIQENVLAQDYARAFVEKNRNRFLICGQFSDADLTIGEVKQSLSGLTVFVKWQGKDFELFAPLHGAIHAGNVALAFLAAVANGVDPERAVAALRTVPQIQHRLEVKSLADGTTYIDDAYNSNPQGFLAALDLLAAVGAEKKARRILITPGIIELGDKNDEIHRSLGVKAASAADVVLVIGPDKIPTFAEGFRSQAKDKELHKFQSFAEARTWLKKNAKAPDVFLIENDLPDVNESKMAL